MLKKLLLFLIISIVFILVLIYTYKDSENKKQSEKAGHSKTKEMKNSEFKSSVEYIIIKELNKKLNLSI